ncbi:MAG TPA: CPBP family intramembrane glutamic endopeptidase, partial [Gemmataceae bacterium]|nr:CPBP family intramembrane glutamic endopeptidase [Gemmataceae bacterium]
VLLFVGVPYLSARMGNVNLRNGFQLRAASLPFWLGALLLGVSLWLFSAEIAALMEKAGFTTVSPELRARLKEAVEKWKDTSPAVVLLALAVTPAIVEEFFFRGYLFNALAAVGKPRNAILVTAILFGIFHVLLGGSLALERIIPTAIMGLVLGWVRWRSSSIGPGILLHACHNSLLLLAALFSDEFQHYGLLSADAEFVPPLALGVAAVVAAAGGALFALRKNDQPF